MPFLSHRGNRIHFEDTGGDAPAILFCHGAFLDHTIWEPVIAELAPTYRCINWDQRAHGMSESTGPFSYWDSASDAVAVLEATGVGQAVFVGMSQGGWLSQRAALASPERVRGLILTATSVRPLSKSEEAGYGALARAWPETGPVGEAADAVLGIQFAPSAYDGSRFIGRWQSKPPALWAAPWETLLSRDDIVSRFGDIRCPTLFVHGTGDAGFPLSTAEEMSSLVGNSAGVIAVEGGTHCMALTHTSAMVGAIRDFMESLS